MVIGNQYFGSGLLWWLSGKKSAYNGGDSGLNPGSGRSPGEGNGNPLQYSCLENPMESSPAGYSPLSHKELDVTEQLNSKIVVLHKCN